MNQLRQSMGPIALRVDLVAEMYELNSRRCVDQKLFLGVVCGLRLSTDDGFSGYAITVGVVHRENLKNREPSILRFLL